MPLTTPVMDLVTVFIRTAVSRRDATASIREASRRQFNALICRVCMVGIYIYIILRIQHTKDDNMSIIIEILKNNRRTHVI